ncbi:MAG: SoxR reducing system RseC family protein [Deltaproteobacteria bacterium]|nr:SoxR reducing system RseC family protein [Deltaproteobacteria bacterium]
MASEQLKGTGPKGEGAFQPDEPPVLTEAGVVEKVIMDRALVRIRKSACCASCDSRHSCESLDGRDMLVEIRNDLAARVGDTVEISVPTRSLLKLSALVYFVPVVALVLGAAVGSAFSHRPFVPVVSGAGALVGSYLVLRRLDRRVRKGLAYQPRMTRILPSEAPLPPDDSR